MKTQLPDPRTPSAKPRTFRGEIQALSQTGDGPVTVTLIHAEQVDPMPADEAIARYRASGVREVPGPRDWQAARAFLADLRRTEKREAVARRWHAVSDHGQDGAPFDSPICDCLSLAPRLIALGVRADP